MNEKPPSARFFLNRAVDSRKIATPETRGDPLAFHQRLPAYAPTPLRSAPEIARVLGVGEVLIKDESSRFGLPAFKILGASWAIFRALESRLGRELKEWKTAAELARLLAPLQPLTLATATDGNHGRAVAHMAALLGFKARIFIPKGTAQARLDGIASEGAQVEIIDGTYDEAVARAAEQASDNCLIISDTSWPGYEDVPRWVMEGYSTIFAEIDDELAGCGQSQPDLIVIQFGVGALAAAAVNHYRSAPRHPPPTILSVEPLRAACALAAMEAGELVDVPGPHESIMAGLNCGRVSMIVWPAVKNGIDAFIAVADERAREAMRLMAKCGVEAGETGAAGLAGLLELLTGSGSLQRRAELGVDASSRLLVLVTEGATDPVSYRAIVRDL